MVFFLKIRWAGSSVPNRLTKHMNKFLTFFFILTLIIGFGKRTWAQCPTGDVTLSTQAQVNAWPTTYPGCTNMPYTINIGNGVSSLAPLSGLTSIGGTLLISPSGNTSLTSLNGLHNITSVGGNFGINNAAGLTNLTGLGALTSIGGNLTINNSQALTSLTGLGPVTSVGGIFSVNNDDALTNLNGLGSITSIAGNATVSGCALLTSLTGLGPITTIGGVLSISGNPQLSDISALSSLTSVGGNLNINSSALTNLMSLSALTSVGGSLIIANNASLTSLLGLHNIAPSFTNLSITNNANLATCHFYNTCTYLSDASHPANISGNKTTCLNRAAVEMACVPLLLPVELVSFTGSLQDDGCHLSWHTASERNNSHFEVESSRNGIFFETIGRVAGNGTSDLLHTYAFLHRSPQPGTNYYRLRQVDFDGNEEYSNVISLEIEKQGSFSVWPNPAQQGTPVSINTDFIGEAKLAIYDLMGRELWSAMRSLDGPTSTQLDLTGICGSGTYLLVVQGGQEHWRELIIIE